MRMGHDNIATLILHLAIVFSHNEFDVVCDFPFVTFAHPS